MGKPEIKLAYQTGALSILNNRDVEKVLDPETHKQLKAAIDEEFEAWFKAIAHLFALVGNSV